MSEFKGTMEVVIKDQEYICVSSKEYAIAKVFDNKLLHESVVEANQNLIVDAFKVRQQINCELSELLEFLNLIITEKRNMIHPALCAEIEQLIAKNTKL